MRNHLTAPELERLAKLHADLLAVVMCCIESSAMDIAVLETARTLERQKSLVAQGASRTMRSRHLPNADGVACAVDLAVRIDDEIRWDWPLYYRLADEMKAAAKQMRITIEWGGDWKTFKDGPHFQLPWSLYP
jgi:peptidoglycan L-alanyl-D-glutamate endopeptidase CwlK